MNKGEPLVEECTGAARVVGLHDAKGFGGVVKNGVYEDLDVGEFEVTGVCGIEMTECCRDNRGQGLFECHINQNMWYREGNEGIPGPLNPSS